MGIATKKAVIKNKIIEKHGCVGTVCVRCTNTHRMIDKMEEANIPAGYWLINMGKFQGAPKLKEVYDLYANDIHSMYNDGTSICFAGSQGTGKTLSSICLLKSALKHDFSAYYITASDILNDMTDFKRSYELRQKLRESDFLVIDELDSRFFISDSTKSLFSGIYENIFRFRSHNSLPTIMCTNETGGILDVFYGPGVQSIESLNHQYLTIYPVVGQDFRKK